MKMGTPRSIDEAIIRALTMVPANELRVQTRAIIKDFLAQRFGVLTDETEKLWVSIFPEEKEKRGLK